MIDWLFRKKRPEITDLIMPESLGETFNCGVYDGDVIFRMIYENQKMEGSSLNPAEAEQIVYDMIAPDRKKSLADAYNLYGNCKAWEGLVDHLNNNFLSLEDIMDIHADALAGELHAGTFRIFPAFIGSIAPPAPSLIIPYLIDLCDTLLKLDIDPLGKAAFAHMALFSVHPFRDGNKRTARTVMNAILAVNGISPLVVDDKNYDNYWDVIESCRAGKNSGAMARWLAEQTVEHQATPDFSP